MRRVLFYLTQVGVLVALAVWLSDHPGKVEINWLGYRIETYFGVLVLVLAILLILTSACYRFWRSLLGAPQKFLSQRHGRKREDGYRALALGMAAVAAGDRDEAKRLAHRADTLLRDPELTRLLSAQAASLNGDKVAAQRYFTALVDNPDTAFLGLTGLMRQAIADGDEERTLELANKAHKIRPGSSAVVDVLFDLQTRCADWVNAQATLFDAVRRDVKTEKQAIGHRAAIFTARAYDAEFEERSKEAGEFCEKALAAVRGYVPAATLRAKTLAREGKQRRAARLLEDLWQHNPHPDLVVAYVNLWSSEPPLENLRRLQQLVRQNTQHTESRIALARTALEAGLWGEARRNLTGVPVADQSVRYCRLMARLEEEETMDSGGPNARHWWERADAAPQDPCWNCESCGAVTPGWFALCGNCGAFDTITWKRAPRVWTLALVPKPGDVIEGKSLETELETVPTEEISNSNPSGDRQAS